MLLSMAVLALRGAVAVFVLTAIVGGIPRVVQLALAVTIGVWSAVMVAPAHAGQLAVMPATIGLAASEAALGAALGIMGAIPLLAASAAGLLVDLAGTARAQGPYGALMGVVAAAVFVGIDGHVTVMTSIVESHARTTDVASSRPDVVAAIARFVPAAVKLAVPWLVTAAVVQIAIGVGMRVAARSAMHVPTAAAVPAALAMMTASLVATFAIAVAALVRGTL